MSEPLPRLLPGGLYHIYNRGNNRQAVFSGQGDYRLFLDRWKRYIYPVAETFAYVLLPNHFHAAVRIREQPLLRYPDLIHGTQEIIDRGFANFFIAYARVFQNRHQLSGALFKRPFQRKPVDDIGYFMWLIGYILLNAARHDVHPDYTAYPHSSFKATFSDAPTLLAREELLRWFGGPEELRHFLQTRADGYGLDAALEEL